MTDAETRQAAAAIAAILGNAGTDPHVTANEIIQALRVRGWRHPIPRPPVTTAGPPIDEDRMHAIADRIRTDTFGTDLLATQDPPGGLDA